MTRFILFIIAMCWLMACCSCTKEVPQIDKCKSVIYWLDIYKDGILIKTDTSIYFPHVCGSELAYYEKMSREPQPICTDGNYLRLEIK